jgi:hypothetical protein
MSSGSPILPRLKTIQDTIEREHVIPQGTMALIALYLSKTNIPASLHFIPAPMEVGRIEAALSAMDVFSACTSLGDSNPNLNQVEPSALISIWSNGLSNWIQFLFSELVEKRTSYPPDYILAAVTRMRSILFTFCRLPETRQVVADTAPIVAMMTRMWLREGNPESFFAGFIPNKSFIDEMHHFLFASTLDRITGVLVGEEEVLKFARVAVGAIDGGYDAIAKAGIEGLLTCISRSDLPLLTMEGIRARCSLLWKVSVFARVESGQRVPHEFATVSVKILSVLLQRPASEGRAAIIIHVVDLLISTIHQGTPIQTITKALESGLMPVLMSLAQYLYPEEVEVSASISDLIEKDIAPCLVYRSVLKSVGNLKSVRVKHGIDESVRSAWLSFKDLVSDRTDLRKGFEGKTCSVNNASPFLIGFSNIPHF